MVETIAKAGLAVNENTVIRRNRISNTNHSQPSGKRVCVVTGTHGDELEGQYVCAKVAEILSEKTEFLNGTVDIYPALNPLGIDSINLSLIHI